MSGITGRFDGNYYVDIFNQSSAIELQQQIKTGLNKTALYNAAYDSLEQLAKDYEKERDPKILADFRVRSDKFAKVFSSSKSLMRIDFAAEYDAIEEQGKLRTQEFIEHLNQLTAPEEILEHINNHAIEIEEDPSLATRAHHALHELAQAEMAKGNVENAFNIASQAAFNIPLSSSHPLHEMDQAILEGQSRQLDEKRGACFSSFDTSIVKGGNMHATQRMIDGKLTNSFDFKISHYAVDELDRYLDEIVKNPEAFKESLPEGFCTDITINEKVPQGYIRYDEENGQFTRDGLYSIKTSRVAKSHATEIVFEGVGKVIIGTNKDAGCLYNWIQVEMNPNLAPGEGVEKLHRMLSLAGLGPVMGQQPDEADARMKIAQLFRAFYPSQSTDFDTTKEFYQLPIDQLRVEIEAREPGMQEVFKKYLDDSPELMEKIEILPGKEIWGVSDFGQLIKDSGCFGLMMGVGNSGAGVNEKWESGKKAVARLMAQGALSSEQRLQTGVFKEGASTSEDLKCGGGDQVFTRMVTSAHTGAFITTFPFKGTAQVLWDIESVANRVPYAYEEDTYGVKHRFEPDLYKEYQSRKALTDLAGLPQLGKDNELMVKNTIDPSHMIGVVVESEERKQDLIDYLMDQGIAEDRSGTVYLPFKNVKADDFIHVGNKFTKEMFG